MTDHVPIAATQERGPRTGLFLVIIAIAFIAGVLFTGYLMKRLPWLGGTASTVQANRGASHPDASQFNPAQPLTASGERATAGLDIATLASREATLAGQLGALEARTAAVTSQATAAAGQATRAEGLLIAFAARRALDRGNALGYLEEQLRTRFGSVQPRAVATAIAAARQPVTLEDLRQGLDAIAPDIAMVSSEGWFASLRREFGSLVVLRQAGTPSPRPADRLARARRLLEGGQVEAARAEVARLPGARDAGNWMNAANRYVMARHALDLIEGAAIMGPPTAQAGTEAADPGATADNAPALVDQGTTSVGM